MKIPPKIQLGIAGLCTAISLLFVIGCDNTEKMWTTAQADGVALSCWVDYINTSQTNWTVTLSARTNQLRNTSTN